MGPALPINAGLVDQAEIDLVNEGGRLERVVGPLAAKMPGGEGETHRRPAASASPPPSAVAVFQTDKKFCDLIACHGIWLDYRSYLKRRQGWGRMADAECRLPNAE